MSEKIDKQTSEKFGEQDRAVQLFEAFSGVDEELLYRSEKTKTRVIPFKMMGMAAACMFMLLVGGAVMLNPLSVKESDRGSMATEGAYPEMCDSDTTENDLQNMNSIVGIVDPGKKEDYSAEDEGEKAVCENITEAFEDSHATTTASGEESAYSTYIHKLEDSELGENIAYMHAFEQGVYGMAISLQWMDEEYEVFFAECTVSEEWLSKTTYISYDGIYIGVSEPENPDRAEELIRYIIEILES